MDNIFETISSLLGFSPEPIVKIAVLLSLFIYVVFSLVLLKQVLIMTKILSGPASPVIKLLSLLLFLVSISIFMMVLLFL